MNETINNLYVATRLRRAFLKADQRLVNQKSAVERLFKKMEKEGDFYDQEAKALMLANFDEALRPVRRQVNAFEREIDGLTKMLPIWPWVEGIRGVGPLGLGLIVGAAGGLNDYSHFCKLWKWFGLAPGQRRYAGVSEAEARAVGFVPWRRSLMYNISVALRNQNDGKYRDAYDRRKPYLMEKHPEWAALKKKRAFGNENGEPEEVKDAKWKYDQEALRYIAKLFLKDLWRAWRDQPGFAEKASSAMSLHVPIEKRRDQIEETT